MRMANLHLQLESLLSLPNETEWVEFKHNKADPNEIGEYLSALSNSAGLLSKEAGYIVWGIEDKSRRISGTTFKPRQQKLGNEELENWLAIHLHPRVNFTIHEFDYKGNSIVIFEVQPCQHTPVRFKEAEWIRSGSYKKKLKDFPEKERMLWLQLAQLPFEKGVAQRDVTADDVLSLIDYPAYFDLTAQNLPADKNGIIERLATEKIIARKDTDCFDVTNLGAILFAKHLSDFESLARKAVRVIIYKGNNRVETMKEQIGTKGYAVGFGGLIAYINDQLPRNEQLGQALRKEVRMYPEVAVRELVANAIIHQDFAMRGDSPLVEIFADRIEIINSGHPLVDTLRFIDEPPQSRNEDVAAFMRRLNICEERGSGIDKVVFNIELFQLPAPEFTVTENHTKAILYSYKTLSAMDKKDRVRACYQHACLQHVSNKQLTNSSLRKRFSIEDHNYPMASRIIAETVEADLIKPYDPESTSRKHAKYIPFWA